MASMNLALPHHSIGARLASNAAVMLGAGAAYQVVSLASLLVVARLYTPEQLGTLTTMVAIGAIVAGLVGGRYDLAIVTEPVVERAVILTRLSLILAFAGAAISGCGGLIFATASASSMLTHEIADGLWLLPCLTFTMALTSIGIACATRTRRYRLIAAAQVTSVVVGSICQIGFTFLLPLSIGLPSGLVVGQAIGIAVFWSAFRELGIGLAIRIRAYSLIEEAFRARSYPLHAAPYSFLAQFYVQLPQLLISTLYGLATAGQFSNAVRLTAAPIAMLPAAISPVLFGEIARSPEDPRWGRRVAILTGACGFLSAPFVAAIICAGPAVFVLALGPQWLPAGQYAQQLVLASLLIALVSGYDRLFDVFRLQRLRLVLMLINTLVVAVLLFGLSMGGATAEQFILVVALLQILLAFNWSFWAFGKSGFSLHLLLVAWGSTTIATVVFVLFFDFVDLSSMLSRAATFSVR